MKRYIKSNDADRIAVKKFIERNNYLNAMKGTGEEIEKMLHEELDEYLKLHPEYEHDWFDDEHDCRIVLPKDERFYPSKELRKFAKNNGFELRRSTSKYVPDYDWYVHVL